MRHCATCGCEIPAARLKALPDTETCVGCSEELPVQGHTYWDGKHTPVLEVKQNGKLPLTRRGFHAQLPFNSPNNPWLVSSMANLELSLQAPIEPPPPEEYDVVSFVPARCHPDRPKAVVDGRCLECALAYYKRRR